MTRMAQGLRVYRMLRPLSTSLGMCMNQATHVSCSVSCQASTSGYGHEQEILCALTSLSRQMSPRHYSNQAMTGNARVRQVLRTLNSDPIVSLHFDRGDVAIPPDLDNPLGRAMLKIMGFESKRSKLWHSSQRLYESVIEQVDSGVLQKAFQTGNVFWSTHVMLMLHVWLIIHRLRNSTHSDVKFVRQRFYNQFQQDVEYRVYAAGVQVGVSKWLKKLEEHFYETSFEFDQVLLKGDTKDTLSDVALRRFFGGEERQRINADLVARYITREVQCLAQTDEAAVLRGHLRFSTGLAGAVARAGVASPAAEASATVGGPGSGQVARGEEPTGMEGAPDLGKSGV